jgi:catechol 2,3-dioxygenase
MGSCRDMIGMTVKDVIDGAADSIYLRDPDQNGLELTWDRPPEARPALLPDDDQPLNLDQLLAEARP